MVVVEYLIPTFKSEVLHDHEEDHVPWVLELLLRKPTLQLGRFFAIMEEPFQTFIVSNMTGMLPAVAIKGQLHSLGNSLLRDIKGNTTNRDPPPRLGGGESSQEMFIMALQAIQKIYNSTFNTEVPDQGVIFKIIQII